MSGPRVTVKDVPQFLSEFPLIKQRVIQMTAQGLTAGEIARQLGTKEHSIHKITGEIYDCIGVSEKVGMLRHFYEFTLKVKP